MGGPTLVALRAAAGVVVDAIHTGCVVETEMCLTVVDVDLTHVTGETCRTVTPWGSRTKVKMRTYCIAHDSNNLYSGHFFLL